MDSSNRSRYVRVASVLLTLAIVIGLLPFRKVKADSGSVTENDLKITYKTVSAWGELTQSEVTVENTGSKPTEGWQIEFTYADTTTVSSIWNAVSSPLDVASPNKIVVANESYNAAIKSNEKITFGMITQGKINEIPEIHVISKEDIPEEEKESNLFTYAIFSQSGFSFQGWKSTITGDVYTGSNFDYQGSELNLLGNLDAVGRINANGYQMNIGKRNEGVKPTTAPDFAKSIEAMASRMTPVDPSAFNDNKSIVVNGYYSQSGNLNISGTQFSGDCVIITDGDITYNVDTLSGEGRVVLFSRNGNVTINGSKISINGIIYAPKGSVNINAYDTSFNGRIIADKFNYQGSIFNATASESDLELLYELPTIHITADPTSIELGESAIFSVVCEEEETPYEVKFRLNGEEVELAEDMTYTLTPEAAGEYTLEAYVEL
ncbi:MAG: cellulose binding domain-containing protein, partial [Clostridiales bacterium]|nr:cellulose binding domain-containing protein [Candidatus Scatonaster coprocaballi]